MKRVIYAHQDTITLFYAEEADRRLIYDMAFEEDVIWQSMFDHKEHFDWAELRDEEPHFFGSQPGRSKYLLIGYCDRIVGAISHTWNDAKIPNMELDLWLRSVEYTGRGIDSKAILLLMDRLTADYNVKTFLMRPWIKNPRAIRAYEKCGFVIARAFDPADYYGKYLEAWGQGDYPEGENVNMIRSI